MRGHLLLTNCLEDEVTRPNIELALKGDRLLWLDLQGTDDEVLTLLREVFRIHPLAVEDVKEFRQRPKIEDYDDFVSIVAYGARSLGEPMTEVHCFYAERYLYDHLIRISDMVDSYRDLLSGSLDAYMSMVSNRLNDVMKQLTIIATVFLPLSFLTGFFGQNLGWLVNHIGSLTAFLAFGIGTEVLAVIALFALFRRRGWLGGGS